MNSVRSIRILSPQEVQQMGKQGVSSTQAKGLPSTSGGGGLDDYVNHRSASRGGLRTGIMSVGAFKRELGSERQRERLQGISIWCDRAKERDSQRVQAIC